MPPAGSKVKHCQCVFACESPIERILQKIPKHGSTEAAHWPHDCKIVGLNPAGSQAAFLQNISHFLCLFVIDDTDEGIINKLQG